MALHRDTLLFAAIIADNADRCARCFSRFSPEEPLCDVCRVEHPPLPTDGDGWLTVGERLRILAESASNEMPGAIPGTPQGGTTPVE